MWNKSCHARAWQRRYGLLKPQRSEGGHRQFDEEDIQRIEEIKRWIESGVPVGKVKALLEDKKVDSHDGWESLQEEVMSVLRQVRPAKLRALIMRWDGSIPPMFLSIMSLSLYANGFLSIKVRPAPCVAYWMAY
jgi:DNA-binding transcriptional MerR regulator